MMKSSRSARCRLLYLLLAVTGLWVTTEVADAEVSSLASAPLISPPVALNGNGSDWSGYGSNTIHTNGVGAWPGASPPPEFVALARTLGDGRLPTDQFTQNVFDYVRNNIEVKFRFGLGKGGRGVVIDQSGTPLDQAELMVKLLRQGGISASYHLGSITLTALQFGQWSGLVTGLNQAAQTFSVDARKACQFLAGGGIPDSVNGASDSAQASGTLTAVELSHIGPSTALSVTTVTPSQQQITAGSLALQAKVSL